MKENLKIRKMNQKVIQKVEVIKMNQMKVMIVVKNLQLKKYMIASMMSLKIH